MLGRAGSRLNLEALTDGKQLQHDGEGQEAEKDDNAQPTREILVFAPPGPPQARHRPHGVFGDEVRAANRHQEPNAILVALPKRHQNSQGGRAYGLPTQRSAYIRASAYHLPRKNSVRAIGLDHFQGLAGEKYIENVRPIP